MVIIVIGNLTICCFLHGFFGVLGNPCTEVKHSFNAPNSTMGEVIVFVCRKQGADSCVRDEVSAVVVIQCLWWNLTLSRCNKLERFIFDISYFPTI